VSVEGEGLTLSAWQGRRMGRWWVACQVLLQTCQGARSWAVVVGASDLSESTTLLMHS